MNSHSRWSTLALGTALALLIPHTLASQATARLIELQRFGWDDPTGPIGRTTPAQRRLDGGMLAQVVDLAEGPDGTLYVLDRDGFKIVAFDGNGTVKRIIGNGKGQGPGEFERAASLTLSSTGELFVLDVAQLRVAVFDTAGTYRRSFPVASPFAAQIRAEGDRLYISQFLFRSGAPNILVYDLGGTLLERVFLPSEQDIGFGRTGTTYRMARLQDGRIAVAHPNPGTWFMLEDPTRVLGRPLVEGNEARQPRGSTAWIATATLRGFGQLSGGRTLILFDHLKPEAMNTPERPLVNIFLGVLGEDGTTRQVLEVGEVGRNLLVSSDGSSFYLTVAEPMYQVVRFRLGPP